MITHFIMPVYNVKPYLRDAIESVLAQTCKEFDLILVDDGATDGSAEICDEYAIRYKNVKVIHKQNGGVSSARNKGLDSIVDGYVCFVDSDDVLLPTMLESVKEVFDSTDADMVLFGMKIDVLYDGKTISQTLPLNYDFCYTGKQVKENFNTLYQKKLWSYCVDRVYKTQLIKENKVRFNSYLDISGEDAVFIFDLLPFVNKLAGTSKIGYQYFVRNGQSMTRKFRKDLLEKNVYKVQKLEELVKKIGQEESFKKLIINEYANSIIWAYEQIFYKACTYSTKQKVEYVSETYKNLKLEKQLRKQILNSLKENSVYNESARIVKYATKKILSGQMILAKLATRIGCLINSFRGKNA